MTGLSIAELVGGRHREAVPVSFSVANPDFDADLEDVARIHEDGVPPLQAEDRIRRSRLRPDAPGEAARAVRRGGEPSHRLQPGAARHGRDPHPAGSRTLRSGFHRAAGEEARARALAGITRAIDTPVMADESVFDPREALAGVHMRLADVFALKIMKSGGIRRALEVARSPGSGASTSTAAACSRPGSPTRPAPTSWPRCRTCISAASSPCRRTTPARTSWPSPFRCATAGPRAVRARPRGGRGSRPLGEVPDRSAGVGEARRRDALEARTRLVPGNGVPSGARASRPRKTPRPRSPAPWLGGNEPAA